MDLGPVPSPSLISFLAGVGVSMAPDIEWRSPEACPGQEAVVEEARRLGVEMGEASFELQAEIEINGEGYTLDLSIRTVTGTTRRQLEADSCDALVRAAALMLAVALEPFRVPPPPEPEVGPPRSDPPDAPQSPQEGDRIESLSPPVSSEPRPAVTVGLFVSGLVGRGIVPGIDGRLQLGLGVDAPWLRAELLGFHAFERDTRYEDQPEIGARIQAWGGSARVGPRFTAASLVFSCPIGVAVAGVIGEGFGTTRAWKRADVHWGFVMAPALRVSLAARLALGIDFEADVAVRRPAFSLDRLGVVHRTPRIGARGGVRLEWQFSGLPRDQSRSRRRL